MKTRLLAAALVLAASVTSFSAFADDSVGRDEVVLKNGGTIRGTVLNVEPGTKVVILEMGSKDPRTLRWAEVADVQKNRYEAEDAAKKVEPGKDEPGYTSPSPAAPVEETPAGKGAVKVHIESSKPVQLLEHVGSAIGSAGGYVVAIDQIRVACASPCDKVIDGTRGQEFAIVGDGVTPSNAFTLNERDKDTRIDVQPGSSGLRVGGVWMAIFGGSSLVAGAITLPLGYALDSTTFDPVTGTSIGSDMSGMKIAGGVMLGAGAALLTGGIIMAV